MRNYRRKKPDLQALYEQKENERIERNVEVEAFQKLVKEAVQCMKDTLDNYGDDLAEIQKVAKFCVIWLNKRIEERQFKHLGKFDLARIWDCAIEQLRRLYGTGKR